MGQRRSRRQVLTLGVGLVTGLPLAACAVAQPTSLPASTPPSSAAGPTPPQKPAGLTPVLATSELVVGPNRFAFGLIGEDNRPVLDARVQLDFFELSGDTGTKWAEAEATFRWVEARAKGIYTAPVRFERAGRWGVEVRATHGGKTEIARIPFEVRQVGQAPMLGSAAPRVKTLTPADVRDPSELCTAAPPCELHSVSLDAALAIGRPTVVLFASPGFCTSAVCAPQHGVFLEARRRNLDRATYVHVEIYKDPRNGVVADAVTAWNLPSEPWVFFVDRGGTVVERFEGIATVEELEGALATLG
ncbi:MAG: FixH family protein [Chloroflexota bacterium]|nr:FixH family protein [Chloroflexota bacterium]